MSISLVATYLPSITSEQLGTAKATSMSVTSEVTFNAPRQHYTDESLMNAWVMVGTISSCLAVMIAVIIASATSMS